MLIVIRIALAVSSVLGGPDSNANEKTRKWHVRTRSPASAGYPAARRRTPRERAFIVAVVRGGSRADIELVPCNLANDPQKRVSANSMSPLAAGDSLFFIQVVEYYNVYFVSARITHRSYLWYINVYKSVGPRSNSMSTTALTDFGTPERRRPLVAARLGVYTSNRSSRNRIQTVRVNRMTGSARTRTPPWLKLRQGVAENTSGEEGALSSSLFRGGHHCRDSSRGFPATECRIALGGIATPRFRSIILTADSIIPSFFFPSFLAHVVASPVANNWRAATWLFQADRRKNTFSCSNRANRSNVIAEWIIPGTNSESEDCISAEKSSFTIIYINQLTGGLEINVLCQNSWERIISYFT